MSESREHIILVSYIVSFINKHFNNFRILVDSQEYPGDSIPHIIDGYKPDVYAVSRKQDHYIIGEAKTAFDLSTKHSEEQISAFLNYLRSKKIASFILSVPYRSSDRAKVIMYFLLMESYSPNTGIFLFDECDWWRLQKLSWHLL